MTISRSDGQEIGTQKRQCPERTDIAQYLHVGVHINGSTLISRQFGNQKTLKRKRSARMIFRVFWRRDINASTMQRKHLHAHTGMLADRIFQYFHGQHLFLGGSNIDPDRGGDIQRCVVDSSCKKRFGYPFKLLIKTLHLICKKRFFFEIVKSGAISISSVYSQ